jgi:hypothetical protein
MRGALFSRQIAAIFKRWRPIARQGGAQSLNPPAFLIDQNRRVPTDGSAQGCAERFQLIGAGDISRKEDESKWIGALKKTFFF